MDERIVASDVLIGWILCVVVRDIGNDLQGAEGVLCANADLLCRIAHTQ